MKLCVFQGTFNPIHNAHLRIAKYVLDKYSFDKILMIPACNPPHKNYENNLSKHRLEMVKLALKDFNSDKIEVSDIEYKRSGKSYTYITICELYKKYEINGKINFIIGTDALKHIENWYKADELKKLVKFITFQRENNFFPLEYNYLREKGYDFSFENLSFNDISSSLIRERIKNQESIDDLVSTSVKDYIIENGLYKT